MYTTNTRNTRNTRNTAVTLLTATALATALSVMAAIAPAPASADRSDYTQGSWVGSGRSLDIDLVVAFRKAAMAQYYVDHVRELRPWNLR